MEWYQQYIITADLSVGDYFHDQVSQPSGYSGFCCQAWAPACLGLVVTAHGTLEHRLSTCGTWASLLHSMWDLPGPGVRLESPALAGGFFTTEPPGKPFVLNP